MENIQIQKYDTPVTEGLAMAQQIIKQQVLAKAIGIQGTNLKHYAEGIGFDGNNKQLPPRHIEAANQAIHNFGTLLLATHINKETALEQLKQLGKTIRMTHFLQTELGWTEGKQKMHLSQKSCKYYGQISAEDVQKINTSLTRYALQLLQIHLVQPVAAEPVQENPQ